MQAEQEQKKLPPKQIPAAHPTPTKSRPANQSSAASVTAGGGRQPAQPTFTSPKTRPPNQSQAETLPAAHPPSTQSRPANQNSEELVTARGGRQPAPPPCTSPETRPPNQSQAKPLPAEGGCDPSLPRSQPARPTNDSTHPIPNPPRAKINKKKSKTPEIMKQWLEKASPLLNTNRLWLEH